MCESFPRSHFHLLYLTGRRCTDRDVVPISAGTIGDQLAGMDDRTDPATVRRKSCVLRHRTGARSG